MTRTNKLPVPEAPFALFAAGVLRRYFRQRDAQLVAIALNSTNTPFLALPKSTVPNGIETMRSDK